MTSHGSSKKTSFESNAGSNAAWSLFWSPLLSNDLTVWAHVCSPHPLEVWGKWVWSPLHRICLSFWLVCLLSPIHFFWGSTCPILWLIFCVIKLFYLPDTAKAFWLAEIWWDKGVCVCVWWSKQDFEHENAQANCHPEILACIHTELSLQTRVWQVWLVSKQRIFEVGNGLTGPVWQVSLW